MIVKKQKPIKFINACNCLVNLFELEQAILWYQNKPTAQLKKIYMRGRYPAVSIHNKKMDVHRLMMMYWLKRDLGTDEYVHHLRDRFNCLPNNLTLTTAKEHGSIHNKGKILSADHKRKIGEASRRRKGIRIKKRCNIPAEQLKEMLNQNMSINAIAKHFGCDWSTIKRRIIQSPELLEKQ